MGGIVSYFWTGSESLGAEPIPISSGDQIKQMIDNRDTFVMFLSRPDKDNRLVDLESRVLHEFARSFRTPIYAISIDNLRQNAHMAEFLREADESKYKDGEKPILFRWNKGFIRLGFNSFDIYDFLGGGFGGITEYVNGQWTLKNEIK